MKWFARAIGRSQEEVNGQCQQSEAVLGSELGSCCYQFKSHVEFVLLDCIFFCEMLYVMCLQHLIYIVINARRLRLLDSLF